MGSIFLVISHAEHVIFNKEYYAYGPYVREMNLWIKNVDKVVVLAPLDFKKVPTQIDLTYRHNNLLIKRIPSFNIKGVKNILESVFAVFQIFIKCLKEMYKADHIHLRCPGNVGLIGCIAQIFFPWKMKTAKYAGNWDWNSKQPFSYRLQQKILRSTLLTHNMKALVYGEWPDRTNNILPFFTASYYDREKKEVAKHSLKKQVKLCFVGTLSVNKSPITSLEVVKKLKEQAYPVKLTLCGDGPERAHLEERVGEWGLHQEVEFLGNVDAEKVKQVLQDSHFLIFISRSEGWPKAVAEAMFWGCVPITTGVSCVPQMIGMKGERGFIVERKADVIVHLIVEQMNNEANFVKISSAAMRWSREYTLEKFEEEIKQLV